jgi:aldose 1-epimerase
MLQQFGHPFGKTQLGETVDRLTLDNGTLSCEILTFGATLQSLRFPDRTGAATDVVLGYDTLEQYQTQDGYLGATVGRVVNRIAKGRFTLKGQVYQLAINDGPNHIHGGLVGFSHRVWTVEELTRERAVLTLFSPNGEEGYPGSLQVKATYQLEGNALSVRYQAQTDRDTPCNLTNHSYFNLSGQASGSVLEQEIQLFAHQYTPADQTSIPLGTIEPVEGTPMDLRRPAPIGAQIDAPFQQLEWGRGYDHNYVLDGQAGTLRPAARAWSQKNGIAMTVETTLPGIQLYTANFLTEREGKDGAKYAPRHAFCLETQFFPDSPNHPNFPTSILRAGEQYDHTTRFVFSVI